VAIENSVAHQHRQIQVISGLDKALHRMLFYNALGERN